MLDLALSGVWGMGGGRRSILGKVLPPPLLMSLCYHGAPPLGSVTIRGACSLPV